MTHKLSIYHISLCCTHKPHTEIQNIGLFCTIIIDYIVISQLLIDLNWSDKEIVVK